MTTSEIIIYFACSFVGLAVGILYGFVIGIVYKEDLQKK